MAGIDVYLLEPSVVAKVLPLQPNFFDLAIIDEASQMEIEVAIPIVFRAKNAVIIGDDRQLPPEFNQEVRTFFDAKQHELKNKLVPAAGLLDSLKNKFPQKLLYYHYRSKFEELIQFSNQFLYGGKLIVSSPATYSIDNPPMKFVKVKGGNDTANKNQKEAVEVMKQVTELVNQYQGKKSIGVITFTKQQADLINELIEKERRKNAVLDSFIRNREHIPNTEDTSFFVKPVEQIQGDERDIIVFSTVFGKPKGKTYQQLGAISDPYAGLRRLNVAVSRSKEKMVVVSSVEPGE